MIDIEAIKYNSSLSTIYESITGNSLRQSGGKLSGLCPFHSDNRSGNFFIYPDNTYHCFACNEHGDIISFIEKTLNISFKEAVQYLGGDITTKTVRTRKKALYKRKEAPEILTDKTKEIYQFFFSSLSMTSEGYKYLKGRGFKDQIIKELKIKSIKDPNMISEKLKNNFSIEELTRSGLFDFGKNKEAYFIFYIPCLIFTAFENKKPVYFTSRNFDKKRRFFKLHNRKQDYFKGDLNKKELYIFEAILDGLSFYQLTGLSNFIILSGLNYRMYEKILKEYPDKRIIVAFDNDKAGKKAENDIYIHCKTRPECFDYLALKKANEINYSDFKDMNDLLKLYELKKGSIEVIKSIINDLSDLDRELFEERAGIMEYEGNQTRPEAECNALINILNEI
ncbi:MAG: toprim domain-containing protein [Candidatus Delongbacteria bacterium]|nr:toprim domain-containing protein [Candidatus Delongbacteria bacterium]